jgi:hypothetical protein
MFVSEQTDLRDSRNYDFPLFSNRISFRDAYERAFGTSSLILETMRKQRSAEMML